MIGQGWILASPLTMALVAGAVDWDAADSEPRALGRAGRPGSARAPRRGYAGAPALPHGLA